jgi:transcriptional regulator with XRE-family HTH domain
MTDQTPASSKLQRFAEYVSAAARRAGYDIDSPRGGGKTELARDSGISASSISRVLSGTRALDPKYFEGLARALRVPLQELLTRSGTISSESLRTWPDSAVRSRPITPREAADELGITDPIDREMFLAMVDRLRRQQQEAKRARDNEADGGAAAEA